jgi:hypothetical protein
MAEKAWNMAEPRLLGVEQSALYTKIHRYYLLHISGMVGILDWTEKSHRMPVEEEDVSWQ